MGDNHPKLGKRPAIQMKSSNGCPNYKFSTLNFIMYPYSIFYLNYLLVEPSTC